MRPRPIDPSIVVSGAMLLGASAIVAPWPSLIVVACVGVGAWLRGPRAFTSIAWLAFAAVVAVVSWSRARALVVRDRASYASFVAQLPRPSRCALQGEVVSMPKRRGVLSADVRVDRLQCDDADVDVAKTSVVRLDDLPADVARGDRLDVFVQLAPARRPREPDLDDPSASWARRSMVASGGVLAGGTISRGNGVAACIDGVRAALRASLDRALPGDVAPIARALVLGEEDLAADDDEAFRGAGLTHLLAVSGAHVALVIGGLVLVSRRVLLRFSSLARRVDVTRVACALAVPAALVYEQLSGDSGSARRATAMAIVVLVARAGGRRHDVVRALTLSTCAALVVDPLAVVDASFVLSVVATIALLVVAPPIARWIEEKMPKIPRSPRSALAATTAATLGCTPWIARLGGAFPALGLAANLFGVPVGELAALPLANAAAVVGTIAPLHAFAAPLCTALVGAARLLRRIAGFATAPRWSRVVVPAPTSTQLAVIIGGCLVLALVPRRALRLPIAAFAVASLLLAELVVVRAGAPRDRLRITVLDVGQGDSILVDFPDGRAMLIDGGGEVGSSFDPGRAIVAPVLAARRRRTLDVVVLTHPHPDHFLGLAAALRDVDVGAFWDTGQGEAQGAGTSYAALLGELRRRHVRVVRPDRLCGPPRAFGGATLELLHPCPSFDPDLAPNDDSFVLRITFGRRAALLVGDAEHEAEEKLLERPDRLRADFLKVGHHGSRTSSSPDLLRAISPEIAAISCGVRNRFGHPHRVTLDTLAAAHVRVARTDVDGAIVWSTDGVTTSLATAKGEW